MSERLIYTLHNETIRAVVHRQLTATPNGYIVEIRPPTRSLEQSARFHAAVRDVAKQCYWNNQYWSEEEWKIIFVATLYKQKVVPALEGDGTIIVNAKTSRLTTAEMSDLTELVYAFGANHGVEFSE